ncbi:MAG: hypothetical protein H6943_04295 [Zoogloeaceae bacterium]|nr:hypothetical protein [Zoogloeaceae bacterium]
MSIKKPFVILWTMGLLAIALFGVTIVFSSVETRYECSGTLAEKNATVKAKIYLKIERYRWWVKLWSPSDGALWVEVPNRVGDYYSSLTSVSDQIQISRTKEELKGLWGYYSLLSNTLILETSAGKFNGQCSKLNA